MEKRTNNQSGREFRSTGHESVVRSYLRDLGSLGMRNKGRKPPEAVSQSDEELSPDAKALVEHKPTSVELELIEPQIMGTRGEGVAMEGRELTETEFEALPPNEKLRYFDFPESQPRFQRAKESEQEAISHLYEHYD